MDKQALKTAAFYAAKWCEKTFVITANVDKLSGEQLIELASDLATMAKIGIKVVFVYDCETEHDEVSDTLLHIDDVAEKLSELLSIFGVEAKYLPHTIRGKGKWVKPFRFPPLGYGSSNMHPIEAVLGMGQVVILGPKGVIGGYEKCNAHLKPHAIAFAVSRRLGVSKLIVLTNEGGLRTKTGELPSSMSLAKARKYLADGALDDLSAKLLGYLVKVLFDAKRVTLCQSGDLLQEVLTSQGAGTLIFSDRYQRIIPVDNHLGQVYQFLKVRMDEGQLKPRPLAEIVELRKHLRVKLLDDEVVGVVGLKLYDGCGEVVCLCVQKRLTGNSMAPELVKEMEALASSRLYSYLFGVTYKPSAKKVFESRGFHLATLDEIPATKKHELESRKDAVGPWILVKYL